MGWPLSLAALVFLGAYAWPILDPELPASTQKALSTVTWVVWALFSADYLIRLWLSVDRRRFLRSNLLDLLIVLLPLLRPLRVFRLVTLLTVLNRRVSSSLQGRVITYVIGSTVLITFCAALSVLEAERDEPDATITSFGNAIWWAITTITTVGYGDLAPVTARGRLVAALLMIGGIALLGVVTATLASWLLDRVRDAEEEQQATQRDVRALGRQVEALHEELQTLRNHLAEQPAPGPQHSPGTDTTSAPDAADTAARGRTS